MPNYAILVGINVYPHSVKFPTLAQPVGEAIRMMEWILNPAKGNVLDENLILLLSPSDPASLAPILAGLYPDAARRAAVEARLGRQVALSNLKEAEFDTIQDAVQDLHGKAGDQGERLFFYYSGHGLSAASDVFGIAVEDAIVPTDYGRSSTKKAIAIDSIARTLKATSCQEQFLFFDCCRNPLPLEPVASAGPLAPHRGRVPTDQFIYSATAMGLTALEGTQLFSDTLLEGLDGGRGAKLYSPRSGAYEVRAERLFHFLREEFLKKTAPVHGGPGVPAQPQRPSFGGGRTSDPVLYAPTNVPDVSLTVEFNAGPHAALGTPLARVTVFGDGLVPMADGPALAGSAPLQFRVPPRLYMIVVAAESGFNGPLPSQREVYDDPCAHPAELLPIAPPMGAPAASGPLVLDARGAAPPTSAGLADDDADVPRTAAAPEGVPAAAALVPSVEAVAPVSAMVIPPTAKALDALGEVSFSLVHARRPARLTIQADDPLAPLVLLDSAGDVVLDADGRPTVGLHELDCPELAPGLYRARMQSPEGAASEALVAPGPGEWIHVPLQPPPAAESGLARNLSEALAAESAGPHVEFPEGPSAVGLPTVSTLIALASHATNRDLGRGGAGGRFWDFGLPSLLRAAGDAPEGIQLYVGGDAAGPGQAGDPDAPGRPSTPEDVAEYLEELDVRIWPMGGQPGTPARLATAEGVALASLAAPLKPGPYWLAIGGPYHSPAVFALVVLEGRTTEVIVHQEADGCLDVSLFLPPGRSDARPDLGAIRELDLFQRFVRNGDVRFGTMLTGRLLGRTQIDPVAGMLGGAVLLRQGRLDALKGLGDRLIVDFPALPDAHAFRGLGLAGDGDRSGAREAFREALGLGLPLLAPAVRALDDAVASLGMTEAEAPRIPRLTQVAAALIPSLLWTAWRTSPADFDADAPPDDPDAASREISFSGPAVDFRLPPPPRPPGSSSARSLAMADMDPLPVDASTFAPQGGEQATTIPDEAPRPGYCANQMQGGPIVAGDPSTEVRTDRAAIDLSKRWPNGTKLHVFFLNGTDQWGAIIRQAVRNIAPIWSDYANITFDFDQPTAHITVNVLPLPQLGIGFGSYSCFLGNDCLSIVQQGRQPAMNLVFHPSLANNPSFLQQEFSRVILHEVGHGLGLIHEHMRPDRPITWDEAAANRVFGAPPNNWSPQTVRQQIIDVHRGGQVTATGFDVTSIMMYQFPAGLASFSDGTPFVTPNNVVLSPMDKVLANMAYPKEGVSQPAEGTLVAGDPPKAGSIATAGQVARYKFRPASPGVYAVATEGTTPLLLSVQGDRDNPAGRLFASEGANISMPIRLTESRDYFIAVRHARPMTGTGAFKISVRALP